MIFRGAKMTVNGFAEASAVWIHPPAVPHASMALIAQVQIGLPLDAADDLAAAVAPHDRTFKYNLVSKATYARRRAQAGDQPALMSKDESERLARLARVWAFACEVWGGPDEARRFLGAPNALMDGRTPLDLTLSGELGGRLVEDVLGALLYGSAA